MYFCAAFWLFKMLGFIPPSLIIVHTTVSLLELVYLKRETDTDGKQIVSGSWSFK